MFKHNFNRNFAIIIGINNYNNGIKKLETAELDAQKLADIIKTQHQSLKEKYQKENEYKVKLLLNEEANIKQLKKLIEDFKKGRIPLDNEKVTVTEDDRLLFYFAGHGIALDALENQEGPVGYLIPQDATSGDSSTYLPMQKLHDALNALPCRHMLAILDCCFAGAFRWASLKREILPKVKVYKERYDRFISDAAWQVITSAADDQKALDSLGSRGIVTDGNEVNSPFAKALFDALCGGADEGADLNKDGIITATELYLYLRDKVEILTENNYKRQTPGLCPLRKHDKGEFIFLLPYFDRDKLDDAPPLNVENNPYKGLQSYDETDSKLFFGREESIKELREQVVSNKQAFTIVLGASGIGKSSIVKAGLIPNLRNSQEHQFKILDPMRPGESPFNSLAQVCLPITDEDAAQTISYIKQLSEDLKKKKHDLENLIRKYNNPNSELLQVVEQLTLRDDLFDIEHLKFTDELQQSLRDIFSNNNDTEKQLVNLWINKFNKRKQLHEELKKPIEELSKALKQETYLITIIETWSSSHSNTKLLLPVDQFEELITLCKSDAEREQFQKLIRNAIAKYPDKIHVVITLRLDFEAQFQTSVLKDYWNDDTRFVVPPMTQDELREVIEKPALEKVLYFDPPSLVDELINEVGQMPGALPLLSFTLSELYLKYSGDRTRDNRALTKKDYEELGRVVGSITKRANKEYDRLVKDPDYKNTAYKNIICRVMLRMISLQGGELARRQVPKYELVYADKEENKRVKTVIKRFSDARLIVEGSNFQGEPYVEPAHDALVQGWDKLLVWKKENEENLILQRQLTPQAVEWDKIRETQVNQADNYLWHDNPHLDLLKDVLSSSQNWLNQLEQEFVQKSILKDLKEQITLLTESSEALLKSNPLKALKNSLRAGQKFQQEEQKFSQLISQKTDLKNQVRKILQKTVYGVKERKCLRLDRGGFLDAIFLPDKQLATSGEDGDIGFWNLEGKQLDKKFIGHQGRVWCLSFSPESYLLASGADDLTFRLWDFKKGELFAPPFRGHDDFVSSVAFNPDGQLIASASKDGTARLWNLKGNMLAQFTRHEARLTSISFSPDGQLLATSSADGTARLWNLKGQQLEKFRGHKGDDVWIACANFSPDGKLLATAGGDGAVGLWNLETMQLDKIFQAYVGSSVLWLSFSSPDGKLLATGGEDGTVHLWDLEGNKIDEFIGHQGRICRIAFSPDGHQLATVAEDDTARLWEVKGKYISQFTGHKGWVNSVKFSPDGKNLATAGQDKTVRLWDLKGNQLRKFSADSGKLLEVSFSPPDGQQLATAGEDGTVRLWDLKGKELAICKGHEDEVWSVSFNPDGSRLATAGEDRTARLWDLEGNQLAQCKGHEREVESISFTPNGQQLVTSSNDGTIRLWDLDGKELAQFKGGKLGGGVFFSISPDGKYLATGGYEGITRLWNLSHLWDSSVEPMATCKGRHWEVRSIDFIKSTDLGCKYLVATSGSEGTVRVWNLEGQQLAEFRHISQHVIYSEYYVESVSFSPDGSLLATAGSDETAKLWQIESFEELMVRGCDWLRYYLENNSNVDESDRHLFDDVPPTAANPNK
ncbi:MAG: caspase family protein [Xenococcaceae cyanobacterium]